MTGDSPNGPRIAPLPAAEWGDDEQRAIAGAFGRAAVDSNEAAMPSSAGA